MDQNQMVAVNSETVTACTVHSTHIAGERLMHPLHHTARPFLKGKRRAAMLWGMAGTIVSVVGFIGLALFEQYNSMLGELRTDLKHFNETTNEYAKRDSVQRLRDQLKDFMKEIQTSNSIRTRLEMELNTSEKLREEQARQIQQMRERLAFVEGRQAASLNVNAPAKK
jgi:hypothetical protein